MTTKDEKKNKFLTAADVTAALTMLSVVPYEIGQLGVVIPPEVKGYAIGIGILATLILRLRARFIEAKKKQLGTLALIVILPTMGLTGCEGFDYQAAGKAVTAASSAYYGHSARQQYQYSQPAPYAPYTPDYSETEADE